MSDLKYGVFYTDGGSRPNNGHGGWGIHGYSYNGEIPKKGTGLKDWDITPVGYFSSNEMDGVIRQDLWGIFPELAENPKVKNVNVLNYYDHFGSLEFGTSNNLAEIAAATKAMELLLAEDFVKANIFIDSRYTLDGITEWMPNWVANNWTKPDKQPIANLEAWQALYELKKQVEEKGTELVFHWVKGHVGNVGNEKADYNATQGVILSKRGFVHQQTDTVKSDGYWAPKVEVNRLFSHNRWYFNTGNTVPMTECGRHIYYLGDHGKDDDMLGKKMSDASFSILYLEKPEPILEQVRREQLALNPHGVNSIVIARLDSILRPKSYKEIEKLNGRVLYPKTDKKDLYNAMDVQLTKELNPPRIAFNLVDLMVIMENLLNQYIDYSKKSDEGNKSGITVTDITDAFYATNDKGKLKFNPEITSGVKSIPFDVNYASDKVNVTKKVSLTLGLDLPGRNNLSALTDKNPKVKVITWCESETSFRYATVVEAGNDVGIYAGFYSNIVLFN